MASKALVISGTNFSVNKLTTVTFGDSVSCTGISLSQNSVTFTKLTTETLTATVTPANTTDTITWSTSNSNVATVSNGIITSLGIGSATITATCGAQTATCSVSISVSLSPEDLVTSLNKNFSVTQTGFSQNGRDYQGLTDLTSNKLWVISYPTSIDGSYKAFSGTAEGLDGKYPIKIPNNATTVTVGCTGISGVTMCYMDSKSNPTYSITNKGARVVYYPSSTWASHPTITLPTDVDNLDSFVVCITFTNATTEMPSTFEITFA